LEIHRSTENTISTLLVFLLGLLFGLYFFVFNIIGFDFQFFPGDLGDARFNMYILEHAHKFLIGKESSLWDAPFMFPEKSVITYSDNLIGTTPFYTLFRLIGENRETAFQYWFVLMCSLNYLFGFLFFKDVFKNSYSAALGAFVFAFSLALYSQISHAQTFPRFPLVLSFWMMFKYFNKQMAHHLFLSIFFLVYQFYCCLYLGFLLFVPLALSLFFIFFSKREILLEKVKDKKYAIYIICSILLNLILLLPLMLPYYYHTKKIGMHYFSEVVESIPTFLSYFSSVKGSLFWDFLSEINIKQVAFWDHRIFIGIVSMSLLICFLYKYFKHTITEKKVGNNFEWLIFAVTIVTFILFFRLDKYTLYILLYKIPGFGSLRSITRIINVELLFVSFAVASFSNFIMKKYSNFSKIIFFSLLLFLVIDNYFYSKSTHRTSKWLAQNRESKLIEKLKNVPKNSVISYEPSYIENSTIDYQIDAMLAAQTLDLICLNGYSSTSPPNYGKYWEHPDSLSRAEWLNSFSPIEYKVQIVQ
jgi:hypothetical protein